MPPGAKNFMTWRLTVRSLYENYCTSCRERRKKAIAPESFLSSILAAFPKAVLSDWRWLGSWERELDGVRLKGISGWLPPRKTLPFSKRVGKAWLAKDQKKEEAEK